MLWKKTFLKKYEILSKMVQIVCPTGITLKSFPRPKRGHYPKKPPKPQKGQLSKDKAGLHSFPQGPLKGLSHEIDLKNVDENGQILALLRAAAGF